MTYPRCDSKRRVLPVVTFVLISYLFGSELVCARPQDNFSSKSPDNDTKEIVAEKVEPINNSTLNDRNGQPIVIEQSLKINTPEYNGSSSAEGAKVEQKLYGDISVDSGLDFGRSAEASTKPIPTVNTLKPISKIGVTPLTATDMVAADVRTPPKIKSQIVHSQLQSLLSPGKGEAIPVVLEGNDEAALEKISSDNFKYTHSDATPSSGLSTWILLNSDSVSTPYSHFKKGHKPTTTATDVLNTTNSSESITDSKKKPVKTTSTTTTTEKLIKSKIEAVAMKKPDRKPIATIQKVNQTLAKKPLVSKIEPEEILSTTTVVSLLQDPKFKNKTPVVVGKVPSTNFKEVVNNTTPMTFVELPADNGTRLGTPVVTYPHVPSKQKQNSSTTRKPSTTTKPSLVILSSSTASKTNPPQEISTVPSSTVIITNLEAISAVTDETQSEPITEITTKKSTTGSKKKKKKNKNKNKRRRPSKKPAKVQSKISEDDNSTSKLPGPMITGPNGSRPLSTRIYNYLAREVMPNMGVGLVGLMLTAGLAGLLLYPFGAAVPVRRNYEKPGPSYNLNDYPPAGEVDNAQPEESVLSQVLAGMSNTMNQYSREQPDVPYKNHQKYKPARFDNPNTYNHHKDLKYTTETIMEDSKFSELGDVVSGPHESVKFTSFDINDSIKYPSDNSPPNPSYSTIDLTTDRNDLPVYHKYSPSNDAVKHDTSVYSTLGEYASYNNPHEPMQNPVYNGDAYDYKNHKNDQNSQEFKGNSELEVGTQSAENQTTTAKPKHEQPSFAALEGIPKNYRTLQTSIRFEDTASVLPLNQDFVPSDGMFAASIEHGPRSMKLRRRKRDISSENEIDSILIETTEKPAETSQPPVQFITETTTGLTQSTEETVTRTTETISLDQNSTSSNDLKILSSSSTENNVESFDNKNKTEPFVITPETPQTSVSENSMSHFVPIPTIQKVEAVQPIPTNNNNCENCADVSNLEEHPAPPQPFSLSKLFRKILDFKFRIGFELIRATTDVISKYLTTVQQRMTEALRDLQRSAFRMNDDKKSRTNVIKKRERRHIIHGS
ncbi:uncharacterized protein LOC135839235 [Planococcus citri]|uniref:uncharacterized protein LOC135839235 n=1 Tax=Planococcus citri TaxID=170843 RepID=UPI0031F7A3EB